MQDAVVATPDVPYTSRMIVRRPAEQRRFNGTVVIEWLNVSAGYDIEAVWLPHREHFLREGYAWVGVSAQTGGVGFLKTWNPARYGSLDTTGGGTVTPQDAPTFRRWEVAGTSHFDDNIRAALYPLLERDHPAGPPPADCSAPPFSRAPLHHVTNAAIDHLARWGRGGAAPPSAPGLTFTSSPEGGQVVARDEHGLALGGIRLAAVEAPTALNTGINGGAGFCLLYGTHVPFDEATLAALYPSTQGVRRPGQDGVLPQRGQGVHRGGRRPRHRPGGQPERHSVAPLLPRVRVSPRPGESDAPVTGARAIR